MFLPKMLEFAYELNCKSLLVEPIVLLATKTKAGKEFLFRKKDKKALMKSIKEAAKIAHEHNFQTNVDKLEFELIESTNKMREIIVREGKGGFWSSLPCYQPFYRMVVRPWGVVGPCCMFDNVGENVKSKSLREIWFGSYFEKMRENMAKGNLPDFCFKCNPSQVQENRKIREQIQKLGG
jgi:MoaA/NifB/PqqE/SkfB family radical SAM enzyme